MPTDPLYFGRNYLVDPENLQLYEVIEGGYSDQPVSMAELSGDRLTASGGAIREVQTGRIVQPLYVEHPAQVSVSPTGFVTFSRETATPDFSGTPGPGGRYGMIGAADLTLPDGSVRSVELRVWSTAPGQRVIVQEGSAPGESERFRTVDMYGPGGELLSPRVPPGWRFAVPSEVQDRALRGWLLRNQEEMLRDAIQQGLVDENGDAITDVYEAAMYYAAMVDATPGLGALLME